MLNRFIGCAFFILAFPQVIIAQNTSWGKLSIAFKTYSETVYQEKTFLHTDRSFYLIGEEIYFKAYLVNSENHKSSDLSKVVYVELLTQDSIIHLQTKISIEEGGDGSFFLPTTLATGKYQIRAYTRWMMNFDPAFYFQKSITIFNPFQPIPLPKANSNKPLLDAQFFPEGGDFVNGLRSKIGFRVVNEFGKGIDFRGIILNKNNDTVATFSPLKFGIGHFYLKPEKANQYIAHLYDSTNQLIAKTNLPKAKEKGFRLELNEKEGDKIVINVSANSVEYEGIFVGIFVHCRGKKIQIENKKISNQSVQFSFSKAQLGEGINHITLFDNQAKPIAERLFFKQPTSHSQIQIKPNKAQYHQRSEIQLDLDLPPNKPSNLSIAVYRLDQLQNSENANIKNYLLLSSDLKGNVESPWYYFGKDSLVEIAADNLMLTHGWRRFDWEQIIAGAANKLKIIPEFRTPLIVGKIIDRKTKTPVKNIVAYLSSPGKDFIFRGAISNTKGEVYFEVPKVYGEAEWIATLNPYDASLYQIELINSHSKKHHFHEDSPINISLADKELLEDKSVYMQARRIYQQKFLKRPDTDSLHFYGYPDGKYFLDDYTRFPTMEEVMREYVQGVLVKKQKGEFEYRVFNLNTGKLFFDHPLVLLDGVPVFDLDKIMTLDPFQIKSIDIKRRKEFLGPLSFFGIISYKSFKGDLINEILEKNTTRFTYQGYQVKRAYFSPKYETEESLNSRLPDFRELLYWNPNLKNLSLTSQKISFFSSDLTGEYEILINGISTDGKLLYGRKKIRVIE